MKEQSHVNNLENRRGNLLFFGGIIVLLAICVLYSLQFGHSVYFYPINGTFQDYNPVRRLLSGQIPYRDFSDYLGMGHLYAGAIATLAFGGTYKDSLTAFSFLSIASYVVVILCSGAVVIKKKEMLTPVAIIIIVAMILYPVISNYSFGELYDALNHPLHKGNSSRFIRGMITPITVFAVFGAYMIYKKLCRSSSWLRRHKGLCAVVGTGAVAGFAFGLSNDYGISCWLCLTIMVFWLIICRERIIKAAVLGTLLEIAASIISAFIVVEIFSAGNFADWVKATFSVGGFQSWYFGSGEKSFYIYDGDFCFLMMLQAAITLFGMVMLFIRRGTYASLRRFGIFTFMNMVCFCAANDYRYLASGFSREFPLVVLFMTVLFELLNLCIGHSKKVKTFAVIGSAIMAFSWCFSEIASTVPIALGEKSGIHIEELGGYTTSYQDDLLRTDAFLNGDDCFSTYASAQEVVSGYYQPSGMDYIIHVLSDDARLDYLGSFKAGDFKYAATINDVCTPWEKWVQRANWFFFRELMNDWHPLYFNDYEVYWGRNQAGNEAVSYDVQTEIVEVNSNTKQIVLNTDPSVNGVADVYIDYAVQKDDRLSSALVFKTPLRVKDSGALFAADAFMENDLRNKGQEYLPVNIINGYGEITLTSQPRANTYLDIYSAECGDIFSVAYKYIGAKHIEQQGDSVLITADYTPRSEVAINAAKGIIIEGVTHSITEVEITDSFILISLEKENMGIKYNDELLAVGNVFNWLSVIHSRTRSSVKIGRPQRGISSVI